MQLLTKNERRSLLLITAVGLLLGAFFDLSLSVRLAEPTAVLGRILEVVGELPALLFAACNAFYLALYLAREHRRLVGGCAVGVLGVLCCGYAARQTVRYLISYGAWWEKLPSVAAILVLTLLFAAGCLWLVRYLSERHGLWGREIASKALTCLLCALTVLVVILGLKLLWGRVRFRTLLELGTTDSFTPWWRPMGIRDTSFVSFPSGHTANACVVFLATLYLDRGRRRVRIGLFLWIVCVAVSRVFVGAHYLSDICAGGCISLLSCDLICRLRKGATPDSDAITAEPTEQERKEESYVLQAKK